MSSNRFIKLTVDKGVRYFNLAHISSIALKENKLIFEYPLQKIDGSFFLGYGDISSYKEPYTLTYPTKEAAEKTMAEIEVKLGLSGQMC
jgi:hypothetical protein